MSTITPQAIAAAGTAETLAAASVGGDTVASAAGARLRVVTTGTATNVTLTGVVACSQGSTHNVVLAVGATATAEIPIPAQCVDPSTGNCGVTYSAVTGVSVGAFK